VLHDAALIAGKDLRLEWRSRVTINQVMPFAFLVLVLFAFALDPDRRILLQATPGLFWLAVLFSALLAIQRAFVVETEDGVRDALRLSGLDPAGIFIGKAAVIAVHLAAVELVLGVGVWVLYGFILSAEFWHRISPRRGAWLSVGALVLVLCTLWGIRFTETSGV